MGWNKDTDLEAQAVIEARLKAMSSELRCLVCRNTTLADSRAPLAEDLRKEIRMQMRAGKSDQEVVDYLVARYGGFVLLRVLKKHAGGEAIQGEDA